MKKILVFILSFLLCSFVYKVHAETYIVYSEWSEEYPYWLRPIYYQSEERFLWYREVLNDETNELEREETTEYYKELDGYIKIEESSKMFYRYITNSFILLDGERNIVYDNEYCVKNFCTSVRLPKKPEVVEPPEEIENPKTYDNIFVFMIIAFISFVFIVLLLPNMKLQIKKAS